MIMRKNTSSTTYRADIDGLRAVAVTGVILAHLHSPYFPGGFVGVDIFFVISGYLITRLIVNEIDNGRFSIASFYERRARRILPALFFMLMCVTIAASIVMLPSTFRVFGASVTSASISMANVYFWYLGGYFTVAMSSRPLLHTWSLGVEEQYYIVFPILLILMRRYSKLSWTALIFPLMLMSLIFSVSQTYVAPRAAFYLPLSRFWELALGSLVAVRAIPVINSKALSTALGLTGISLIAFSFLYLNERMPFPGWIAAVPCIGATLIIYSGSAAATPASIFLSLPLTRYIGLISYSLYLWHWPLIVLMQSFILQRSLDPVETALLLLLLLIISSLSWRYVERPFRIQEEPAKSFIVLRTAGVSMAAFATLGLAIVITQGFPERFGAQTLAYAMASEDSNPRREDCDSPSVDDVLKGRVCHIGVEQAIPSFAVVGDSFGDSVIPGIDAAAVRANQSGVVLTHAGCNPLFGVSSSDRNHGRACRTYMDAVADFLKKSDHIRSVVVVGRWTRIVDGTRFGIVDMADVFITDADSTEQSFDENRRVFARALDRMSEMFADKTISVVAFFPEQQVNVAQAAFLLSEIGIEPDIGVDRKIYDVRQNNVKLLLADASKNNSINVIDVGEWLCDENRCRATEDGKALYIDDNHLTAGAALKYSEMFDSLFVLIEPMSETTSVTN